MKRFSYLTFVGMLSVAACLTACSSDDDNNNVGGGTVDPLTEGTQILFNTDGTENPNGTEIGSGVQEFTFKGKQTLKKGVYTLKGWVYIADGAELTIEPGTVIKGDKETKAALIAERGGKLIAKGTATAPIVFTSEQAKGSRKPGDWGGVILCGKAPNNAGEQQIEGGPRSKHGGSDANDNSGVLEYVRIEFAGYPFQTDKEINGLTLGSVGSGTKIDHIQVSYSNDDSFEWFGGTVNCDHLIAYKGWDDDFDTDYGFSGNVQYGLSVRDSKIADTSQSNGFESDTNASGTTDVSPLTKAIFSNITFIGPKAEAGFDNNAKWITAGDYNPNNGSSLGKFQAAMQIRRASQLNCVNSVAMDWPIGLILDGEKGDTPAQAKNGNIRLQNVWFANMDAVGTDGNKVYGDSLCIDYKNKKFDKTQPSFSHTWFASQSGNRYFENKADLKLVGNSTLTVPFMPQSDSPMIGAASFDGLTGFETVNYIGAFKAGDNWLDGWTNFDPQNADY